MFRALAALRRRFRQFRGRWWILALDSILPIPLVFAVFFFPAAVLTGLGVALILTVGTLALMRFVQAHQHPHR